MCRPLREMGGGVNDMYCCATHSQGVLKPHIHGRQDAQLNSP